MEKLYWRFKFWWAMYETKVKASAVAIVLYLVGFALFTWALWPVPVLRVFVMPIYCYLFLDKACIPIAEFVRQHKRVEYHVLIGTDFLDAVVLYNVNKRLKEVGI